MFTRKLVCGFTMSQRVCRLRFITWGYPCGSMWGSSICKKEVSQFVRES